MRLAEAGVAFVCDDGDDGCGLTFIAKPRYALYIRRGVHRQLCRRCARGALRRKPGPAPDADDLLFWLERFSDVELASIVVAFFDAPFDPDTIAQRRAELMGVELQVAVAGR